jgi:tRNA pseudouridine55 synthase
LREDSLCRHRWPVEEATSFERNFAEQVWKIEKQQLTSKKLSPEEEEQETKALTEHENFKRKSDETVDALVYDRVNKRRKAAQNVPMMSGALGELPPDLPKPGKGSNLIPSAPDPNTPPPWDDKGPPAARIRMTVTSGFYVRSFCHDLGTKVGSAALMAELCRSRQGDFVLGGPNCLEYDDLAKGEAVWAARLKEMLASWNSKPASGSSHPTRARTNPPSAEGARRAESKSPRTDAPSALRGAAMSAAQTTLSESKDKMEDVTPATPQITQKDAASPPSEAKAADSAPKVGDAAKTIKTSRETDDESWNGFEDSPAVATGQ